MSGVDPRVREIAEAFVEDMLDEVWRTDPMKWTNDPAKVEPLVRRAAGAIKQAVEQELEAIRAELVE